MYFKIFLFILTSGVTVLGQATYTQPSSNRLKPFQSDGCSFFPNGIPLIDSTKWLGCCVSHDLAYWHGGTAEQRQNADQRLSECVAEEGAPGIADLMYFGVRFGGYAGLPTTWRWGYGWTVSRDYSPLNFDEQQQVQTHLLNLVDDLPNFNIIKQKILPTRDSITGDYCVDQSIAYIYSELQTPFLIETQDSITIEKADGWWKTISILPRNCIEPFEFTFHLLRADACRTSMNELLARGRIRLTKISSPTSCI